MSYGAVVVAGPGQFLKITLAGNADLRMGRVMYARLTAVLIALLLNSCHKKTRKFLTEKVVILTGYLVIFYMDHQCCTY